MISYLLEFISSVYGISKSFLNSIIYSIFGLNPIWFNWLWIIPALLMFARYIKNYNETVNTLSISNIGYNGFNTVDNSTYISTLQNTSNIEYVLWDGNISSNSGIYIQILILNGSLVLPIVLVSSTNPIEIQTIEHEYARCKEHYAYHSNNMLNIMYITAVEKDLEFSSNYKTIFRDISIGYPIYPVLEKILRFSKHFYINKYNQLPKHLKQNINANTNINTNIKIKPLTICITSNCEYLKCINNAYKSGLINSNYIFTPFIKKTNDEIKQIALNRKLLFIKN